MFRERLACKLGKGADTGRAAQIFVGEKPEFSRHFSNRRADANQTGRRVAQIARESGKPDAGCCRFARLGRPPVMAVGVRDRGLAQGVLRAASTEE